MNIHFDTICGENMPRKVKRHWGDDGWYAGEPFCYYGSEVNQIARSVGVELDSIGHRVFLSGLAKIGIYFVERHGQRSEKFTRAESRAELDDLQRARAFDWASLWGLNARAYDHLFFALIDVTSGQKFTRGFMSIDLMDNLIADHYIEEALKLASARLKAIKGPDQEPDLYLAVERLCQLYEALTDKPATHSNKGEDLGYVEEPQSEAGRFVTVCFALIDKKIRPAQISRAMRGYVSVHKKVS